MSSKKHQKGECIVKYKKVKSRNFGVGKCINYITNPEKTQEGSLDMEFEIDYISNDEKVADEDGRKLVFGHNCSPENAIREFEKLDAYYHKNKSEYLNEGHRANNAFHIIISYKGKDISPREVHDMGREFTERLCGDEYMAITATHLNTENIHNHIVVCAYGLDGMHKLQDTRNIYKLFKEIAHEISLEHGLPVRVDEEEKKLQRDKKEYRAVIAKRVEELRKQYPDNTHYRTVYVSAYDEYGRHRSGLERMLITIKEMMKQGSEAGYREAIRELDRDNTFFKPLSERLKLIEEAEEICGKYEIGSIDELDEKLRQLHAENSPYRQKIKSLETYLDNVKKNGDKAYGMSDAELNPMQPKTKSDLFKAVHDSEYTLMKKFVELSDDEGREMIKAIRSGRMENLPSGLVFGRIFFGKAEEGCKKTKEEFDREVELKKQLLEKEYAMQKPVKSKISELYKVKINMEKYIRPEYVFGILYNSDVRPLTDSIRRLKEDVAAEKKKIDIHFNHR